MDGVKTTPYKLMFPEPTRVLFIHLYFFNEIINLRIIVLEITAIPFIQMSRALKISKESRFIVTITKNRENSKIWTWS